MDRLEMVLKGLKCCGEHDCANCPFDGCVGDRCVHRLTSEAHELLVRADEIIKAEVGIPDYMKYVN